MDVKCRLLLKACRPVLSYRCSRWPPQKAVLKDLSALQAKMMAVMLRVRRIAGEDPVLYCRRRNRAAADKCRSVGLWTHHWCSQVLRWEAHLLRGHGPTSWPVMLRHFNDEQWLETCRCLTSLPGTRTRVSSGRPAVRWHEGVLHANSVLFS